MTTVAWSGQAVAAVARRLERVVRPRSAETHGYFLPDPELAEGGGGLCPLLNTVFGGPDGLATETVGAGAGGDAAGALGLGAGAGVVAIDVSFGDVEAGIN